MDFEQLKRERDRFYREAGRLLARCEELSAALGEACTIGDALHHRYNPQGPHPRLSELRELHLPLVAPTGQSIVDQVAWTCRQRINAQAAQARAYQIADGLRTMQTELEAKITPP